MRDVLEEKPISLDELVAEIRELNERAMLARAHESRAVRLGDYERAATFKRLKKDCNRQLAEIAMLIVPQIEQLWDMHQSALAMAAYPFEDKIEALNNATAEAADAIDYALGGITTLGLDAWADVRPRLEASYLNLTGKAHPRAVASRDEIKD